jgi:hypothetical protein
MRKQGGGKALGTSWDTKAKRDYDLQKNAYIGNLMMEDYTNVYKQGKDGGLTDSQAANDANHFVHANSQKNAQGQSVYSIK